MMLVLTQASRPDRLEQFYKDNPSLEGEVFPFYSIDHKESYKSFCLSWQAMLRTWFYSTVEKDQFTLLFEDDCQLKGNITFPKIDFDIVYFGCNLKGLKPEPTEDSGFMKISEAWMSHCIGFKRSAVEYIIKHYNPESNWQMFDDYLSDLIKSGTLTALVANPMIAYQRPCKSDLWNNFTDYTYTIDSGNEIMNS